MKGETMSCTTILVGKGASADGSTMVARNDDSPSGKFTPKKFVTVLPGEQPRHYKSVLSHVEIDLPDNPMRYTAVPNAVEGEGIWAAAGVNEANVAMTATETITSNVRVLGADPLVEYVPAKDGREEIRGGIGEEDIVVLVLPYICSAREGVVRLGALLEEFGTYEMNGIAFQDRDEIWWLETIGGHHWMARRVPDNSYVIMPNQLGIDSFDLGDAEGAQKEFMCSTDLRKFLTDNHLDLSMDSGAVRSGVFNPRWAFGSHDDSDHVYNTPRAWFSQRYFNRRTYRWDGPEADYTPASDDIAWALVPEKKITPEDVKYVLSAHFQGTKYDPYSATGDLSMAGAYRAIGVNRTDFMALTQIRHDVPDEYRAIEWICFGSNTFNAMVPFYANVEKTPDYLSCTTGKVSTDSFYWANRLIGALADAQYSKNAIHIERYQESVQSKARAIIHRADLERTKAAAGSSAEASVLTDGEKETAGNGKEIEVNENTNESIAVMLRQETDKALDHVLYETSLGMKNSYARSDA